MAMKIGDKVKQVTPVIAGPVVDIRYDRDTAELTYLVDYVDDDGVEHQRWFKEDDLEIDADAEPESPVDAASPADAAPATPAPATPAAAPVAAATTQGAAK